MNTKPVIDAECVLKAVRRKCLDCSGNQTKLVDRCEIKDCPLYPYRTREAVYGRQERAPVLKGQISIADLC